MSDPWAFRAPGPKRPQMRVRSVMLAARLIASAPQLGSLAART